jgi:endonuclease-8
LLAVYGRESKPCRVCGASIRSNHKIISGRSTYWCPDCQPGHPRPGSRKSRNVLPHH